MFSETTLELLEYQALVRKMNANSNYGVDSDNEKEKTEEYQQDNVRLQELKSIIDTRRKELLSKGEKVIKEIKVEKTKKEILKEKRVEYKSLIEKYRELCKEIGDVVNAKKELRAELKKLDAEVKAEK